MEIQDCTEAYFILGADNLAEAFDYAANDCHVDLDDFMSLFIVTGLAESFANGDPRIVVGLSGTELVMEVVRKSCVDVSLPLPKPSYERSPEYWAGWALGSYQRVSGKSFKTIHRLISVEEIVQMYHPFHEASLEKFVESMGKILAERTKMTKLQRQRKMAGFSQKELAEKSGVNLRTLQQYEVGAKDIRKASTQTVLSLASTLGCEIQEILG